MIQVQVQRVAAGVAAPSDEAFETWARAALAGAEQPVAVLIRLVDEDEARRLNHRYRGQDKATNVLSFAAELDRETRRLVQETGDPAPLGDLVICAPVVEREAEKQEKRIEFHWAHLVVHGALHLLGHDHQEPAAAREMEALEQSILAKLGMPDPYAIP